MALLAHNPDANIGTKTALGEGTLWEESIA